MKGGGQRRWGQGNMPVIFHPVFGVAAIICTALWLVVCPPDLKAQTLREVDIKAAIAENILQRAIVAYDADTVTAIVERQTYFQLLVDNMQLLKVGRSNEKGKSWSVVAKVHIPVSPASGGRGYDVYLAEVLKLSMIRQPDTYVVQKTPNGNLHARRSSEKEGENDLGRKKLYIVRRPEMKEQSPAGLHEAAQMGDVERTKALVDSGADINAKDGDDMTPLCLAAGYGRPFVAKLLLERGANINTTCKDRTPIHLAVWNQHKETVDLLIQYGADVNAKVLGASPLWMAASKGYAPIVKALVMNGADIDARDDAGYTPLHEAAGGGHREAAEVLLDNGAQINAKASNTEGWTPLHFAAFRGSTETVRLLLSRGADPNAKGNDGFSPKMVAERLGRSDVLSLLESDRRKK
jgi:ankyrin repeat protein